MNSKEKNARFWLAHSINHASQTFKIPPETLFKLASYVSQIGHFSTIESLKKVADLKNAYPVKKLVETLNLDEDEDYNEEVDEGGMNHHNYFPDFVENPTNEPSQVNDYSMLSVQEGFTP